MALDSGDQVSKKNPSPYEEIETIQEEFSENRRKEEEHLHKIVELQK